MATLDLTGTGQTTVWLLDEGSVGWGGVECRYLCTPAGRVQTASIKLAWNCVSVPEGGGLSASVLGEHSCPCAKLNEFAQYDFHRPSYRSHVASTTRSLIANPMPLFPSQTCLP